MRARLDSMGIGALLCSAGDELLEPAYLHLSPFVLDACVNDFVGTSRKFSTHNTAATYMRLVAKSCMKNSSESSARLRKQHKVGWCAIFGNTAARTSICQYFTVPHECFTVTEILQASDAFEQFSHYS